MKTIRWYAPPDDLRERFLSILGSWYYLSWLDSNQCNDDPYGEFEFIAACGNEGDEIVELEETSGHFLFGGINYSFLIQTEPIQQAIPAPRIQFPDLFFFKAQFVLLKRRGDDFVEIQAENPEQVQLLLQGPFSNLKVEISISSNPQSGISEEAYIEKVQKLQHLIREGEVYEANLSRCLYFTGKCSSPSLLFSSWVRNSPVPFSAYLKWGNKHIYSGSPERFLAHRSGQLISQPIKGTAPRAPMDSIRDQLLADALQQSEKDKAENVMIVDLVRNDLNRSCVPGTVQVPELFGLHSFPWVYHLISTITGTLRENCHPLQALRYAFPPGSMTGAPKVSAMKIINQLEPEGRGIFAGCLGYKLPNGDFDFNVLIRTLVYDSETDQFSYHAGGAITIDSDPIEEYQETVHKSNNLLSWLEQVSSKNL